MPVVIFSCTAYTLNCQRTWRGINEALLSLFFFAVVCNDSAIDSQVVVEVPDGKFRVQLFQKHQMTSLVTTDDLEKHLLIARGTEPQRNPAISDFHFGDTAEMTASAAVLLGQIEVLFPKTLYICTHL